MAFHPFHRPSVRYGNTPEPVTPFQKAQQVWFIKHFGANVNLGNIAPQEVVSVETIRQKLRGDTLADT